ncbi:MAG: GSU2086 family protein [Anaerolineae bacterium]
MSYPLFDRSRLQLKPLAERQHDMTLAQVAQVGDLAATYQNPDLDTLAQRMVAARRAGSAVIWMMGAHVIKNGLSRYVIDLMERGAVSAVAFNGACCIHDFELALIGATTESVARYVSEGQFGLWTETGRLNEIAKQAAQEGIGFGEAVGRTVQEEGFPHRDVSILAAGYRLRIPVTVHVSLGYDIIHEHPNVEGAALGAASYTDFLVFTQQVTHLEGGVLLSMGTAIMGPEVYLKALAMARNVAFQENRPLNHFTTAVFDLQDLGEDLSHEAPKSDARYYFRPYKTILVRTIKDGGESFYIQADHKATVPALHRNILRALEEG